MRLDRTAVAAAAAALLVGFGGGYLVAKAPPAQRAATGQPATGFAWPFFGKLRDANAPRAAPPKPEGFAVWTNRLDTSRAEPLACIRLTRPLDPRRSYADFVQITPEPATPPAVTVQGDELCVAGGGLHGQRITLLKGLRAANGETLAANADVDFTFADQPPYVGFAGQGVILPREEADGLGIETVNVTKLEVEVVRVPDRNLVRKQITAPDPTPEGDYAYEDDGESAGDDGRVVWKGMVPVKAQGSARTTTVFPLGAVLKEMRAGAYVVKTRDASGGRTEDGNNPPASARRWILFTDMGLMAYTGSDGLDVVVRSLKSARTLPGVRVALVAKDGEDLASVVADGQGRVHFAKPLLEGEAGSTPRMLMAYGPNADFAALDLDRSPVDLSAHGVGGRTAKTAVDAYLYADRGIYRPGETVHLVALVRDQEAKAISDRKGALVIRRPSGVEFQRLRFDKADAGALARDLALPRSAPRGNWRATLELDGIKDPVGQLAFSVEDFVPQRLDVTATGDADRPLAPGENRPVQILARFLYGATGAGLDVQAEARIRADADPFPALKGFRWGDEQAPYQEKFVDLGMTVTDGAGRAVEAFDSGQAGDTASPLAAAVTASVFEPGGRPVRESLTLKLRTKPLYLGVRTTSTGSGDNPTQNFEIVSVDAGGRRVAASGVAWTLISENWDYDWFQKDGRWQWRRTSRDAVIGRGALNIGAAGDLARVSRRLSWGDYRLVLEDAKTGARTVIRLASGWGEPAAGVDPPDSARVSAGETPYVQGDTVSVTIKAPYAGEAQVAVATDRVIDFRTVSIPKEGLTVKLKTSRAWGGGAYVLVSVIQPRDPSVTPKPRRALGLVYVPLDPGKRKLTVALGAPAKLDSKAPIEIPVTVQGLPFGGRAHVTVAAVDEGILRLTHQESPDPAKWYFGRRALSVDYRDDYGRLLDPNLGAATKVDFGGDEVGGEGLTVTPFKTVALWSGVVETGLGGKATVKLPAADFNGELRLMAVAWTDEAVGSGQAKLTVRRPVIAELATPRFLAPGDKAFATLELHNVEGKPGGYTALISSGGIGATFQKLFQLALGQRVAERTPLNAPAAAGVGAVALKVTGPGFVSDTSYPLQTRLGWGAQTKATIALQRPGESYTPPSSLMAGMAAGTVGMTISYSPFRGFDPAPIAEALSRYPYGCTEQLVSAAYPLIYAQSLSADRKLAVAPAAVAAAVGKVLDRQAEDGSFGLWRPGDGEADAWLGAYTTDFLVEARARGAAVPAEAMTKALQAMRQISRPSGFASVGYRLEYPQFWTASPATTKAATARMRSRAAAYALYVMAKAQTGDLARLRWFHDVQMKDEPSPLSRAHVGAGLALMGDRARAHDSFVQAVRALGFKDQDDWYQSSLRDLAGVISLAYEAGEPAIARQLQGRLEGSVTDVDSLNTQEQARLLQAADAMLRAAGPMKLQATGVRALGPARWAVGRLADARIVNGGTGGLWRTVTVHGVSISPPGASAAGLSLDKRLFSMTGGAVDPASLTQGGRVIVRLSGVSAQGRSMMTVIDDALPAGFEVETVLGPEDAKKGPFTFLGELTAASVQEARDDRYVATLTLPGKKGFALAYVARAVTPGDFFLPGAEARDMYRPSVVAHTASARARIAAGS